MYSPSHSLFILTVACVVEVLQHWIKIPKSYRYCATAMLDSTDSCATTCGSGRSAHRATAVQFTDKLDMDIPNIGIMLDMDIPKIGIIGYGYP